MSVGKTISKVKGHKLSMRMKLILSLLSIGAILLLSCSISVMEYTSMSNYVSGLISDDIHRVEVARKLADMSSVYNRDVLAVIADGSVEVPEADEISFKACCDSLRIDREGSAAISCCADSVLRSYSLCMMMASELDNIFQTDSIDSKIWFYENMQPCFDRLDNDIATLSSAIYTNLKKNSETFDRGFYRSVVPGIVAVGVGLLLILMLLFFILSDYVKPLYRMLAELNAYKSNDKKYSLALDGDDQLNELNEGIREITSENRQLRERIKALRNRVEINGETK